MRWRHHEKSKSPIGDNLVNCQNNHDYLSISRHFSYNEAKFTIFKAFNFQLASLALSGDIYYLVPIVHNNLRNKHTNSVN